MSTALNPYVWELYMDSTEGQQALTYFADLPDFAARAQHGNFGLDVWQWLSAQDPDADTAWEDEAMDEMPVRFVAAIRDFALSHAV